MPDILSVLRLFADFAGVVPELVDAFAAEHPELVTPPDGPPEAAQGRIDAEVDAALERGEL